MNFKLTKKDKFLCSLTVFFWVWLVLFLIASIIFFLQVKYLEPEPGSTYETDIMLALLCYIFVPIGYGLFFSLITFFAYLNLKYETNVTTNSIEIKNENKLFKTEQRYVIKSEDIIGVKKSWLFFIVGRCDIKLIIKGYYLDDEYIESKRDFVVNQICTKEEKKKFLEYISYEKK